MKKIIRIIILGSLLILFNYCAKPTVVDVTMPDDEKLNCEELEEGYLETRRFKKEATAIKEVNTGGNITRTMLFWPALVKTIHNADVAIKAADDRGYHLVNIMKNKNCENASKLYTELTKTTVPVYVSTEIKKLYKLYKKGAITLEEYELAKKKLLNSF